MEVFHLQEQLFAANSWMEALQQERDLLARELEAARSRECVILGEILTMISWAESAEEKVSETKAALKDSREKLIDSFLCSVGLERTIRELKGKIAQDPAELLEQKKA